MAMRNSDRHSPVQIPLSNSEKEPLKSQLLASVKGDNYALMHQRQCRCKRTKCLKLYCVCFASGYYCNGCKCADCHNNIENEAARREAADIILERNPNAFRSRIAHSALSILDTGVEARDTVVHIRGCHCQKTGCIKRYCECFLAHILCSEKCKCVDCKNKEGYKDRLATLEDHGDTKTCIEKVYTAPSATIGLTDHSFSLASSKRKSQEPIDTNEDTQVQVNSLLTSDPWTVCSVISQDHVHSSTILNSLFTYRSLLAEIVHPHAIKKFCSHLVAELVAAKTHPGVDLYVQKLATDDHSNENEVNTVDTGFSKHASAGEQEGMLLSTGTETLLFEKGSALPGPASPYRNLERYNNGYAYVEQERLILKNFHNFLMKLVSYRGMDSLCASSDI